MIHAIRWKDADFAMPPKASLTPQQVQHFEQWVKLGAPDPRIEVAATPAKKAKTHDLAADQNWWAFRPVVEATAPEVKQPTWVRQRIDAFMLKELETKELTPSPKGHPRSLLLRTYIDLTGLRPS
ncbi:MAG: hypothetical protein H7343_08980 [Undibacterium sp.]|nr:hypothetical protein [Opitutaceae bacterium]